LSSPSPQRAWRALCPNCGAPVEFASAASASAVCSFCRSTLVRDGEALKRIGVSAELFDDHSPLQLGASGTFQGLGFTLIGRLQYGYGAGSNLDGTWNEWHAHFVNGRSAWLSEDNGAYVFALDVPLPADAPKSEAELEVLRAGSRVVIDARGWSVASVVRARLIAAQGELPAPPRLEGSFTVVDLRNEGGEVGTLDASDPEALHWSRGRSVLLPDLRLQGLRDTPAEKTLKGRAFECPSCGAALELSLSTTKSIACRQCAAVIDVSQGVGGELRHFAQNQGGPDNAQRIEPQLPLGKTGTLALDGPPLPWQIVGYQERRDVPDSAEEESTFWREYLLYNQTAGFAFLVDTNEGWSWVRPLTGVPQLRGDSALWQGTTYRKRYGYAAITTWVQGEFYWRVAQGERAYVIDYEAPGAHLSREQAGNEVTWSAGKTLQAATVADAFGIEAGQRSALQRDAAPLSASSKGSSTMVTLVVLVIVVVILLSMCSSDGDCDEIRSTYGPNSTEYQQCARSGSGGARIGGGSYGGYRSGGGGHK
jgi:predicted RNA-binding Zn-ribbon protein involved in translation (DUF1610 family)